MVLMYIGESDIGPQTTRILVLMYIGDSDIGPQASSCSRPAPSPYPGEWAGSSHCSVAISVGRTDGLGRPASHAPSRYVDIGDSEFGEL